MAADVTCADPIKPAFDSAVYESWSDRTHKRWRTTITYPDHTTFDVVISSGLGLVFRSSSGYGGATGDWSIAPPDFRPTGIIEYPPGERSWPISLDGIGSGDAVLRLPSVTCGSETFEIELPVTIAQ